ncbi:glycosyltransferase [Microseira wollei]|uniref:Glycosyl transferase, family 2 n=1 Tax=Microseira wollei NIES-4236 TaxID=2530354 RepID=A0AAV3XRJ3_9CYAN|nr:glycosyltransferase [Microseira wollei]GET43237.1 glycosyl transferase, family 2 [Microseira wollei NIES-4236]
MVNANSTSVVRRPTLAPLPPSESHSITVVIPALNEEGNLERLVSKLEQTFPNLGYKLPVLLVDDGSTDNSPQILARLMKQLNSCKSFAIPNGGA